MKKFAIALCVLCGVGPFARHAYAADVTIKLNDQQQQALLTLLDLAAKSGGARVAPAVSYFLQQLATPATPAAPAETHGTTPAPKPEEKKPVEGVK